MDEITLRKLKNHTTHIRNALERLHAEAQKLTRPIYKYGGEEVVLPNQTKNRLRGILGVLSDRIVDDCDTWISIAGGDGVVDQGFDLVLQDSPTEIFRYLTEQIEIFNMLDLRESTRQTDKTYKIPDLTTEESSGISIRIATLALNAKRLSISLKGEL